MKFIFNILTLFIFCFLSCASEDNNIFNSQENLSIIPNPVSITYGTGKFIFDNNIKIENFANAKITENHIVKDFKTAFNIVFTNSGDKKLSLKINKNIAKFSSEAYSLKIDENEIEIAGATEAGIFYGYQTLKQILPAEIYSDKFIKNIEVSAPCLVIADYPMLRWRGAHLDSGRHFVQKEDVKKYIDNLAMHKINTFHWHLTEDQGWRIEIKKYPKLTEIGSKRKGTLFGHYNWKPHIFEAIPHEGFYTQDDCKEIVKYAADRFINVVPEIDMPGHTQSLLAAYPEYGCTNEKVDVHQNWGVIYDVLNPNEKTVEFVKDILSEVLDIFPSKYVHLGGDECPKKQWKENPEIQKFMQEKKLKNEDALQSWFIEQLNKFLISKNRVMVGWDEILDGGLAENAVVMSWRGEAGGIKAANMGHDVVMTPSTAVYLDYYQSKSPLEPLMIGGYLQLEKVFKYEPFPKAINESNRGHIIGFQGNVWTEYLKTFNMVEYAAYPRLLAVASGAWCYSDNKNFYLFKQSLEKAFDRFAFKNIKYRFESSPEKIATINIDGQKDYEIELPKELANKKDFQFYITRGNKSEGVCRINNAKIVFNSIEIKDRQNYSYLGKFNQCNFWTFYTNNKKDVKKFVFTVAESITPGNFDIYVKTR